MKECGCPGGERFCLSADEIRRYWKVDKEDRMHLDGGRHTSFYAPIAVPPLTFSDS